MSPGSPLLKWSGFCAIVFGLFHALSNIAYIGGIGQPQIASSQLEHFQIITNYSNPEVGVSLLLEILSYLFLLPAMIGMMVYLRRIVRGLSLTGFTFGLVGTISMMLSSIIRYGASDLMANRPDSYPILLENQVILFHTLAGYVSFLSLPITGLFFLLWGIAFRKSPRPANMVGTSFLLAFLFLLSTQLALTLDMTWLVNTSAMLKILMISASFILSGGLLRKDETLESSD